jgi:hypothetical protein
MKGTIRIGLSILFLILAVGAIDGPTGHENDNWLLCFTMMFTGIAMGIWGIKGANNAY